MNTNIHAARPTPHDWPEDWADPGEDNGCYRHICSECGVEFTGHKRRPNVCKICATEYDAEMERRAEFLSAHDAPMDWVITTMDEVRAVHAESVQLITDLHEERALRRKLATALKKADEHSGSPRYWHYQQGPGKQTWKEYCLGVLAESAALDESPKNR